MDNRDGKPDLQLRLETRQDGARHRYRVRTPPDTTIESAADGAELVIDAAPEDLPGVGRWLRHLGDVLDPEGERARALERDAARLVRVVEYLGVELSGIVGELETRSEARAREAVRLLRAASEHIAELAALAGEGSA